MPPSGGIFFIYIDEIVAMLQALQKLEDIHVAGHTPLATPAELKADLPVTEKASETVVRGRQAVEAILAGDDSRFLIIAGPCSIHDPEVAYEYAKRLKALSEAVSDRIFIVMRAYFEKPRTTTGWKGLVNDPHLDGSCDLHHGIRTGREVLLRIADMGVPVATEVLDPIVPQYLSDLVTWASIGARTTESQTHREMASGLSMPVGFKNSTDGNLQVAINAMLSARHAHHFLGIDQQGRTTVVETRGNRWGHIILRGGSQGPNYTAPHVADAEAALTKADLPARMVIDCSHANSSKDYTRQPSVLRDVIAQRAAGTTSILGAMLESNLNAGNQKLGDDPSKLEYGVSITDGCIDWETTDALIREIHQQLG